MFNIFKHPLIDYHPPLSEQRKIDEGLVYLNKINQYIDAGNIVHMVGNNSPLMRLLKSAENSFIREDEYEYLRIGTESIIDRGRMLGCLTQGSMTPCKDMGFTKKGVFDVLLLEDVYVIDIENEPALRCRYHPFTHVNIQLPDGKWEGNPENRYSTWTLNIYVFLKKWRSYVLQAKNKTISYKAFLNTVLADAIPDIIDLALLNRASRRYELDDNDVGTNNRYPFYIVDHLSKIRMYPQRTSTVSQLLHSIPSIRPTGILSTLELGKIPLRKHVIFFWMLSRLETYHSIASMNKGNLPKDGFVAIDFMYDQFQRYSIEDNYGMLPVTMQQKFNDRFKDLRDRLSDKL